MLAVLRGDAERAIMFASQALANLGGDEWMLASHANGYRGLAEWLRGRLAEAELRAVVEHRPMAGGLRSPP